MSGEIRTVPKCEPCWGGSTWGQRDCTNNFGAEWDYINPTDCNYNCKVGSILPGQQAQCRMNRYNGDKKICCLGSGNPGGTCAPGATVSSGGCDDILSTYCASGNLIFTDPACAGWTNQRPAATKLLQRTYSLGHLESPWAQTWCKQQSAAGDNVCDIAVQDWCATHATDPFCACVKSPLQDPHVGINPKCNDRACINTGYITQNMAKTACPDLTNCTVQANIVNSGIQLAGVSINQSCGPDTPPPTITQNKLGSIGTDILHLFENPVVIIAMILMMLIAGAMFAGVSVSGLFSSLVGAPAPAPAPTR